MKSTTAIVMLILLIAFPNSTTTLENAAQLPLLGRSIVIDPGHGGIDPGACGNGLTEEKLVLELAMELKQALVAAGADVRLTRETDQDLSHLIPADQVPSRKRRDIMGRVKLANDWQPDVVLSLHVNAIASSRWRGAQVFFQQHNPASAELARQLQHSLSTVLGNTNREAKAGDYRILNDVESTAALLEVGFISNPEEARLLAAADYRQKLAYAITVGLLNWWGLAPD